MEKKSLLGLLLLMALVVPQIGCLQSDSGTESGTEVDVVSPIPDPNTYVCNPLEDSSDGQGPRTQGLVAELYYLTDEMPIYHQVSDYIDFGKKVEDMILYFNQIYIPTRPFDRGFTTVGGQTVQTENGDTLYEYFALKMRGRIELGDLPPGAYQFALLADDGANFYMDFGNGLELVVDNDGTHPTKMGCGQFPVIINEGDQIPFQLEYYQGPRYHIAAVLMVRPWPESNDWQDAECGRQGNSRYFDSTQDPPTPQPAYLGLLDRGWAPLAANNYVLPEDKIQNPCNEPAPTISNLSVVTIQANSITFRWQTDIPSDSRSLVRLLGQTEYEVGASSSAMVTSHELTVTGLSSNTDYQFLFRSTSSSGLSSDSGPLTVRTRR